VVNLSYPASGNSFLQSERWVSAGGTNYDDAVTILDPLGRPILGQMRQASGGSSFDTVQTCYDAMGRPYFATVPYSGTLGQKEFSTCPTAWTAGGSFTTYDGLSRPIKVVDGGGGESDYAYNQNDVLSTVVGTTGGPTVSRQQQVDGIGRLRSVCEITAGAGTGGNWPGGACGQTYAANGYLTTYAFSYNGGAQGPVTTVTQNAQSGNPSLEEPRTLQYDQLGRLTSELNPETEQRAYAFTYDSSGCGSSAGDLVERQDPNGNTVCYSRDAAHRVTEISYSGPNPTDNKYFVYGTSTTQNLGCCSESNVLGRLAEAYTGSPSNHKTDEVFGYTSLGQPEVAGGSTPGSVGWYQAWEAYWPDGARQSLTLEDNLGQKLVPTITYSIDGEGRPTGVTDGSAYPPVTAAAWLPYGLQSLTFGSTDGYADQDSYGFDATTGRLASYSFSAKGSSDSGTLQWLANGELSSLNISDQLAAGDNGMACSYAHDDMGRLGSADCGTPSNQSFSFDPFGNVCKNASSGTSFCPAYNTYNQMASGTPAKYDLNGNQEYDPTQGATVVNTFDAENKPVQFENATVVFDASGRAVEETSGGTTHQFLYGPDGAKLAVMSGQTLVRADVPLPGGAEAVYGPGGAIMYYRHADLLGSSRLATTQAGSLYSATAYAPFGEAIAESGAQDRSFTGKKQDIASGQAGTDPHGSYDFPAREYSPTQSRWWTPDPAGLAAVDPENPQSWNRYAYACDPLLFGDPSGMANPCTIDVGVSALGPLPQDLKAIESRVNQIYAATPAADGDITQIHFTSGGSPRYSLEFLFADLTPTITGKNEQVLLGAYYPHSGPPAEVFTGTIAALAAAYDQTNVSGVEGTIAAHELIHEITGIGDVASRPPTLMGFDSAESKVALANAGSFAPTGYSQLSQAQATALNNSPDCINERLKPPSRGAGGGGLDFSGFDNWWFWFQEWLNGHPPPPPAKDPCPYGDCKK